jgi:hypothetical protein
MSDLETTEMKLRSTPTGGVAGEHSPYYRRLLSAGYKGFMQGTIGGAGFYGLLGLVIGGVVALPAMAFVGTGALLLIPAAAAVGMAKGATTFGNIGSVAAISAESADLAEQRRYLLDRYYDLPEGPEGDRQAEFIKEQLATLNTAERPRSLFHWKTVAICAAVGGLLALTLFTPIGAGLLAGSPVMHVFEAFEAMHGIALTATATGAIGAALGGLMGAVIGIDRSYVRKWFDGSERLLHDDSHEQHGIETRMRQLDQLRAAERADNETRKILERRGQLHPDEAPEEMATVAASPMEAAVRPLSPELDQPLTDALAADRSLAKVAELDQSLPDSKVHSVVPQHRLADIKQAMSTPVV